MAEQELLKVLDLPKEGQAEKLPYYVQPKPWEHISSGSFTPSSCDPEYCEKCRKKLMTWQDEESECPVPDGISESLADLAFRLRNEVDIDLFWVGMIQVMNKAATKEQVYAGRGFVETNADWWWKYARPIHWIIAALIAKEQK